MQPRGPVFVIVQIKSMGNSEQACFCLPYNGDSEFILDYCRRNADHIFEVYGTDGFFGAGRLSPPISSSGLFDLVPRLREIGVGFNYLLNSISIRTYLEREGELNQHLEQLKNAGVQTLTVAHPFMVKDLKEMGFRVSTSLVQNIKTLEDGRWAEFFGYDRLVFSDDLNRHVSRIRALLDRISIPLEVLVNNMCLPSCPLRQSHYGLEAYANECGRNACFLNNKKRIVLCRQLWNERPDLFLKSGWIRPEDVSRYLEIGVRYVKIAGRDRDSESLRKTFDYYIAGECEGKVFDYLLPHRDPMKKYGLPNWDNKMLDNYFEYILSPEGGCDGDCDRCHYCNKYLEEYL